jgi:hypothetical protein
LRISSSTSSSQRDTMTEPIWLIYELPDTGGKWLRMLLAEQLEQGRDLLHVLGGAHDRSGALDPDDLRHLETKRLDQVRVVIGDRVDRSLTELFPGRRVREAVILRNPAERLVSHYNRFHFVRKRRRKDEAVPSFDEWYERQGAESMVRWLGERLSVDATPTAVLEALAAMDFVSTTEDMPKTVPALLRAIGIEPSPARAGTAANEPALELDGELRARLEAENPNDHLLYAGVPVLQRLTLARLERPDAADGNVGAPKPASGAATVRAAPPNRSQRRWRMPAGRGRTLTVFHDDVFLVSYPRSGNSWVRFLIANLLHQDGPASPEYVGARLPGMEVPDSELLKLPRPRFLKTHEPFHPLYPRVIYIVRDPRDVVRSYLGFLKRRNRISDETTLESFMSRFVAGRLPYGSWRDHAAEWTRARAGDPDFLLVRYERLKEAAESELERIATFAGISADDTAIRLAVERSSQDSLRALEEDRLRRGGTARDALWLGTAGNGTADDGSEGAMNLLVDHWRAAMTELGYLPRSEAGPSRVASTPH